jgi:hypothetical protein
MSRQFPARGGYAEIRKLVAHMTALADWMEKYRPDVTVLTLWPKDLKLLCRHPETAAQFQITVPASGPPKWRRFCLMTASGAKTVGESDLESF